MRGDLRTLLVLGGWRVRIAGRTLAHDLTRTFQGRIAIILLLVAAPSLWHLARGGAELVRAPLDENARIGALLVSHVALILCFAVALPAFLLREFVVRRREEPLLAHPWILPELHALRLGMAIVGTSAYLWFFFYLFFARLLVANSGSPVRATVAHGLSGQAYFVVLGALLAHATRKAVLGGQIEHRARLLQRLMILPFLAAFPLFVLLPSLLLRSAPELLTAIGASAPTLLHLVQAPLVISQAAGTGDWLPLLVWGLALLAATVLATRAVWEWRLSAPGELPSDLFAAQIPSTCIGSSGFGRGSAIRVPLLRLFRLFWQKDVRLRARREPGPYLRMHATAALAILVTGYILQNAQREGFLDEVQVSGILGGLLLLGIGWIAMVSTLGGLGREGAQLTLLRPILSPRTLLGIKFGVGWCQTFLHTTLLLVWFAISIHVWNLPHPPWRGLVAETFAAALVLTALGSAIGFLLPDFQQKSSLIPGASTLGRILFSLLGGGCAASLAAGRYLLIAEVVSPSGHRGFSGVVLGTVLLLSLSVAIWGTGRLGRLEP